MRSSRATRIALLVASLTSLALLATPAFAQEQCFPDCREGFVCSPQGTHGYRKVVTA
ncbi:MAG: hypothetical protein GY811_27430 [Myxococcales bacterium]|nr:hypothetical protein [Myxococcales bacterium]